MSTRKTRTAAAEAARKLLQDRVDAVADLAEAGTQVDTMAAGRDAAEEALQQARAAYMAKYQAALALGWTDEQLAQTGCSAERAGAPRRRPRGRSRQTSDTPAPPPQPPTAGAAETSEEACEQPAVYDLTNPAPALAG